MSALPSSVKSVSQHLASLVNLMWESSVSFSRSLRSFLNRKRPRTTVSPLTTSICSQSTQQLLTYWALLFTLFLLYYRITEWFGLKGTWKSLQSNPPSIRPGCSGPSPAWPEHCQGWGIQNYSQQPLPVPHKVHSEEFFTNIVLVKLYSLQCVETLLFFAS